MAGAPDFAAEGLLEDLDGDERAARLALLEGLHERGVPLDELRRAVQDERLALLPVEMALGGRETRTAREVADEAGLDVDFVLAQSQALGLPRPDPDAAVFNDDDLEAARRSRSYLDAGFSESEQLDLLRVMGRSMAQVIEAVRELFGEKFARPGDTERDLAVRYAMMAQALRPQLGETLGYVAGLHLLDQTRSAVVTRAELMTGLESRRARRMAVAFADLVGFTRLGARVPVTELGAVAGRLADLAHEVAAAPVRLVKTIGDAAMLVSPETPPLVDAILALVDAADVEGEDFPQLRAGVAVGAAVTRGGDWYGHTVNLASRVTGIARPGSVLVTVEARDDLGDAYRWSDAGERRLKGIERRVQLYRARHVEAGADQRNR